MTSHLRPLRDLGDDLHHDAEEGAPLLDELRAALARYVVFPSPETADAVTLWVVATHAQPAWEHAPRLVAASPEKRCGKSRLMDVIEATANAPLVTVNASIAAVVRSISEHDPPTLMVDEADTIFGKRTAADNEDLRGILNAGHQRGRPYVRWDMNTRSREDCPTFCMAMLAGIGDLPDTIMDRAIVVRMRRRAPGENVAPYRSRRDAPALHVLRDRVHAWVRDRLDELEKAVPDMPVEDRAADTWEPLVAIADTAGGDWPARARTATLRLVTQEYDSDVEASLGGRLLADLRGIYTSMTVTFLPSREAVTRLRQLDEAPWADLDLTARALSDRLRPYGITPRPNTAGSARGYRLDDFTDAFARYLPPDAPSVGTVKPSETPAYLQQPSDGSSASDTSNRQTLLTEPSSDLAAAPSDPFPSGTVKPSEHAPPDGSNRQTPPNRQTVTPAQSTPLTL